ncbi:MAG: toll/interleukin-1 receptor domain-containing protein [Phycisphaerae bacterium]|nr:toll/interleukin-1 receptor domain-containing protein [Phycisphaerae bacterium]
MKARGTLRPREAFISHASADRRFADRFSLMLGKHGVPFWYSRTNIQGAQQWHDEIGEALRRCDTFIVLLSPVSVKSKWVRHELMYALREAQFENRIVPLLIRKCDPSRLSWTLPGFQIVDFSRNFDSGCRELLRSWGLGFKP